MNAIAGTLAGAVPVTFSPALGDAGTIPMLVDTILSIEMEAKADYARQAILRAKVGAMLPPVPPQIHIDILPIDPVFADLPDDVRQFTYGRRYIVPHMIERAIDHADRGLCCEIVETTDEKQTMVFWKKPLPMPPAVLERVSELLDRLAISRAYVAQEEAAEAAVGIDSEAAERRTDERAERQGELERIIVSTPSRTTADLVAKARLYHSDPERYRDELAGAVSLDESIASDILALFGADA